MKEYYRKPKSMGEAIYFNRSIQGGDNRPDEYDKKKVSNVVLI
jgi:hypothetical protein